MASRHGKMILYNSRKEYLSEMIYHSPARKLKILEVWRLAYGKQFAHCYYHIVPSINERELRDIILPEPPKKATTNYEKKKETNKKRTA